MNEEYSLINHYEQLYGSPRKAWERSLIRELMHDEEFRTQQDEQREARQEIRAMKAAH